MFTFQLIGYVRSPFSETTEIPKGPGTQHRAEGIVEIKAEFEEGLLDIEGFSHLFVIWVFHRSEGYALTESRPQCSTTRNLRHPLAISPQSDRSDRC
jgi:tRNA (Thr-GGU) A37 N-methylase